MTGATGFIGRNSLQPLLDLGYEVHAVARRVPARSPAEGVVWHSADLLDDHATERLVNEVGATHLLHFAWYAEPGRFWSSPENASWVQSTLNLMLRFHAAAGERAVLAGTCAEYELDCGFCSELVTPLRPQTLYGISKNAVRAVAMSLADVVGLSVAWGRVFFVYGPAEHPARLVSSLITRLLRGEPAECTDGRLIRDFLHAGDVASAFVTLLDSDVRGAVNVASGEPVSILAVAERVADIIGRPELLRPGALPSRPGDPPLIVGDIRRLEQLAWRPAWTLETGLAATVEWWRGRLRSASDS